MILQDGTTNRSTGLQMNRRDLLGSSIFLALAGATAGLAHVAGIRSAYADLFPLGSLEEQVPRRFDEWAAQATTTHMIVDPTIEQTIAEAYDATLGRTYINARGGVVELVLAYVRQVTDSHRVHDPEMCYPAQGYAINDARVVTTPVLNQQIPVTQFTTRRGRHETQRVHYWIVEGPNVAASNLRRKLNRLQLGLSGLTPDGMLVRLTTTNTGAGNADGLLDTFTDTIFREMPPPLTTKLLGRSRASG